MIEWRMEGQTVIYAQKGFSKKKTGSVIHYPNNQLTENIHLNSQWKRC